MKRIYWLLIPLVALGSFFTGFFIRQPKINKLKKQVETLQRDNRRLIALCEKHQQEFRELLLQHKALKVMQFRKRATTKEQMTESLTMQYAIMEYITLLTKRVKYEQKLTKEEIAFFNAFDGAIDGKQLSTTDKVKIAEYVKKNHGTEIKELRECDYSAALKELQLQPQQPKLTFCVAKLDPKKKPEYYLTEDSSIVVGDMIVVPAGWRKEATVEVLNIEHCDEDTAPVDPKKAQSVIRKCSENEVRLLDTKRSRW